MSDQGELLESVELLSQHVRWAHEVAGDAQSHVSEFDRVLAGTMETLDQVRLKLHQVQSELREAAAPRPGETTTEEWCVFWGGPDPDNCAGQLDCEAMLPWMAAEHGLGVARRVVRRGPWQVQSATDSGGGS